MLFAGCLRAQLLSASKRGFLLGLRHKTHATSVYKEEARKLLLLNGAALVLAAFAGFGIYQGVTAESYIGPDEIYYAYYMKHTSGPFTQESYDWLEEQGEEFAPMLEVQRKVAAGELSSDAMLAFSSLQQKYSVYSRVINQNINYYLKEHPGAWLVYESGYKELFGFTGDADVQDTLLAGLACALCFSGLFSMERRGGMETILCTTPLGRKRTVRAKLAVSAGVAVLIAAASCLPHLIQVLRDYGLPALFAPAMSISEFESLPALFTLSDVLLFWFVCRIAACLCMGAITLTLGRVFGNLLPALFVSAVGYCLPALLSLSGMDGGIEWLGFWPLFHAANFFTTQGYAGEEGLPYNNAWVILVPNCRCLRIQNRAEFNFLHAPGCLDVVLAFFVSNARKAHRIIRAGIVYVASLKVTVDMLTFSIASFACNSKRRTRGDSIPVRNKVSCIMCKGQIVNGGSIDSLRGTQFNGNIIAPFPSGITMVSNDSGASHRAGNRFTIKARHANDKTIHAINVHTIMARPTRPGIVKHPIITINAINTFKKA